MTNEKEQVSDNDIASNTDQVDNVYSNLIGNIEQPKQCANETMNHDDPSTIHLDGTRNGARLPALPARQHPNELVSLIIDHLSYQQTTLYECTLVNRQLYAIANPLLWKTLKLGDYMQCARFFTCLFDASPPRQQTLEHHIRDLRLDGYFWTDARLTRLLPHLPLVEKVILGNRTRITDSSFQQLAYYCQHLSSLTLYDINQLTDVSFAIMGRYCRKLCELKWDTLGNGRLAWVAMLTPCPLQRLGIRLYHYALDEDIMAIIKTFDRLTCLEINQMVDTSYNTVHKDAKDCVNLLLVPATTTTSESILWPQLKQLILDPCGDMKDTTLVPFIMTHPHLQVLRLTDARHLTDKSLAAMAQWLPHLVELQLTGNDNITPNAIRQLIHQCPKLKSIMLNFCRNIVPASSFPELLGLSKLGLVKWGPREIDIIKENAPLE